MTTTGEASSSLELRIVPVGAERVGKSSLNTYFFSKKWIPCISASTYDELTLAGSRDVTVDSKTYNVSVIDAHPTSQDANHSLAPHTIGVADGVLLIYDITSRSSFEALPQLVKRIQELKENTSAAPPLRIVVVGNKRDLEPSRQVSIQDGMTYAASLGAPFFETSAKEGTNVEESFTLLIRECVRQPGDPGCFIM